MDRKPLSEMTQHEIKQAVKEKYGRVAKDPCATFNFPVGKDFALKVGYPKVMLEELPASMYESFTGANNPLAFCGLKAWRNSFGFRLWSRTRHLFLCKGSWNRWQNLWLGYLRGYG